MDHLVEFVKHHWELWLAFVVILGLLAFEELKKKVQGGSNLSAQEMAALMNHEDAVVIDIRASAMFQKGHILHAVNIQKADFTLEKMTHYKNRTIVVVDENGYDASGISAKIKKDGVEKIFTLNGGITAWKSAGLPLVK